eukprot:tig00000826_g4582.t1
MMTRRRPALELFCDWPWEPARCPEGDFGAELGAALARMLRRSVAGRFAAAADAAEALFGPARALPAGAGRRPGADGGDGDGGLAPRARSTCTASAFSDASSLAGAYQVPPAPALPVAPAAADAPRVQLGPAAARPAAAAAALDPSGVLLEEKARPRRRAAGPALAPTLEGGSASEEEGSGSEEEGEGADPPEAPGGPPIARRGPLPAPSLPVAPPVRWRHSRHHSSTLPPARRQPKRIRS